MPLAVCLNGRHGSPDTLRVSVLDRGFAYGDGVFEVLRTYHGQPFDLDAHLARLEAGLATLGIVCPVSRPTLASEVYETIARSGEAGGAVRVVVTRGEAHAPGLDPSLTPSPTRVVMAGPLGLPPAARYRMGVTATRVVVPWVSSAPSDLGDLRALKSLNYLASLRAQEVARARGGDEALLREADGVVREAASANVFAVVDGAVVTPEGAGLLPGVTRARVLGLLRDAGIALRFAALDDAVLSAATELFLTASLREVMPVTTLDTVPVGDGLPGPLTRRVHRLYRAQTPAATDPMPWET